MNRFKLLDLFCCQGGAAVGYYRAGFEVTGVDNVSQPKYPFRCIISDAIEYALKYGHLYDIIHASPPCQAYSEATPIDARKFLPRLIAPTRKALLSLGKPYIIENVENARTDLIDPVLLCGTMFGLGVWRHRYFETYGFTLTSPRLCNHYYQPVTVHSGSNTRKIDGKGSSKQAIENAMDIHWMTTRGLYEAIPPDYTEYIGKCVRNSLEEMAGTSGL